mmetsp:Transcript_29003/g.55618  ORF Transcript_29003/g.55618 Transcript_29003/m.55618 type:complete len:218 (+) Transcript_29003:520-1173(+)
MLISTNILWKQNRRLRPKRCVSPVRLWMTLQPTGRTFRHGLCPADRLRKKQLAATTSLSPAPPQAVKTSARGSWPNANPLPLARRPLYAPPLKARARTTPTSMSTPRSQDPKLWQPPLSPAACPLMPPPPTGRTFGRGRWSLPEPRQRPSRPIAASPLRAPPRRLTSSEPGPYRNDLRPDHIKRPGGLKCRSRRKHSMELRSKAGNYLLSALLWVWS